MRLINREELQAMLNAKAGSLSRSVVDHLRFRLRAIFELALSEGIVDRNPARALYTPRCQPAKEKRILTSEQFMKMLCVLKVREQAIARLATIEGMRPGEILALRLGDIEFNRRRISVDRRVYRGNIDTPKSLDLFAWSQCQTVRLRYLQSWL
jgi:integrase